MQLETEEHVKIATQFAIQTHTTHENMWRTVGRVPEEALGPKSDAFFAAHFSCPLPLKEVPDPDTGKTKMVPVLPLKNQHKDLSAQIWGGRVRALYKATIDMVDGLEGFGMKQEQMAENSQITLYTNEAPMIPAGKYLLK